MAPKTLYNAAEVQQKVTETAEKAVKTLEEEGWEFSESTEITCDYLGAVTGGPPLQAPIAMYPFGGFAQAPLSSCPYDEFLLSPLPCGPKALAGTPSLSAEGIF